MQIQILPANAAAITQVVKDLRAGQPVAIPTETVYGLAADAMNPDAIRKIFSLKGRPNNHPVIVHIAPPGKIKSELSQVVWSQLLSHWARDVPVQALQLAQAFWPGPLTMILPKAKDVLNELTGGQETVGLRCPSHPVALKILEQFGGGLAAPSANRFGCVSPTCAAHVEEEFSPINIDSLFLPTLQVIDGGACELGIESTIVDLSRIDTLGPVILRPGVITAKQISDLLGLSMGTHTSGELRHSGGLAAHYAPKTKLQILAEGEVLQTPRTTEKFIFITYLDEPEIIALSLLQTIDVFRIPKDALAVSKVLYAVLRDLDKQSYTQMIVQAFPLGQNWDGVRDRLERAATGSGV